ncbi:MAG: hypothetical protein M1818_004768 [Claussenomyces sp. TS43310]|nr:MAG: hypothetical protein M1818_004768 [Claussenomyces sp. TS43310]
MLICGREMDTSLLQLQLYKSAPPQHEQYFAYGVLYILPSQLTLSRTCSYSTQRYVPTSEHHLSVSMLTQITDHVHAMQEPATAPWGLSISDADFERLKAGFEPQDMDDKWCVSVTDQSQSGTISIHLARSWTGMEFYVLVVKPSDGGSSGSGVTIEAITWEQIKGGFRISEEQAKKEVVMITRSLLKCDFDALPKYDPSDFWNHPGAQLGAN